MRALSICLMFAGVFWALFVGWLYLALSGIAAPVSTLAVAASFAGQMIGPLLLIVGSALVLKRGHAKAGAVLALVGCVVLTVLVGRATFAALHPLPLQAPPAYGFFAITLAVALASDVGAFLLYRRVFAGS